jgi:hypothetical protein
MVILLCLPVKIMCLGISARRDAENAEEERYRKMRNKKKNNEVKAQLSK